MKVVVISKADSFGGGASRVAENLTFGLNQIDGITAIHINSWRGKNSVYSRNLFGKNSFLIKFLKRVEQKFGFIDLIPFELPNLYLEIRKQKADILHFHDLTSAISPITVYILSRRYLTFWTMHDVSPITAGCIYPSGCTRYLIGCGECPQLGTWPLLTSRDKTKLMRKIRNKVVADSKINLISPSIWLKEIVENTLPKSKKVTLINNGVQPMFYKPQTTEEVEKLRKKYLLNEDLFTILIIAADLNDPRKGGRASVDLLKALSVKRNFQLILLGNINENFIQELPNVPFHIAGFVENEKLKGEYFRASDAMLFSSLEDNQPLVVLESMLSGHRLFSLPTGGVSEMATSYPDLFLMKSPITQDENLLEISKQMKPKSFEERLKHSDIAEDVYGNNKHIQNHLETYKSQVR